MAGERRGGELASAAIPDGAEVGGEPHAVHAVARIEEEERGGEVDSRRVEQAIAVRPRAREHVASEVALIPVNAPVELYQRIPFTRQAEMELWEPICADGLVGRGES